MSMNTGDLCPRGRELKDEWKKWNDISKDFWRYRGERAYTHQAYRQHVDTCEQCKGVSDEY